MRVTALVSLALALAAFSMPLSARAGTGISFTESTGTFGAGGSQSGDLGNQLGRGVTSSGSENGSFGSVAAAGSESGDLDQPGKGSSGGSENGSFGSATAAGSQSGSVFSGRRSTPSVPSEVKGEASYLSGKVESAVDGVQSAPKLTLGSRDTTGGIISNVGVVGEVEKVAGEVGAVGGIVSKGKGVISGAEDSVKGTPSGIAGSIEGSA